ncbi:MAG: hypothetical protein V3T77_09505 [Planctomycetota bacterium]
MSKPLLLKCRCGWKGNFGPQQRGLTLNCAECDRELYITDDPVEFLNRNVGDQDFSLLDEDFSEAPPMKGAPPQRRPLPGEGLVTAGPSRRRRRELARRERRRFGLKPLPLVILALTVVGGIVLGLVAVENRKQALANAHRLAREIGEQLALGHYTATEARFLSRQTARKLARELEAYRSGGNLLHVTFLETEFLETEAKRGTFLKPATCSAIYHVNKEKSGHRLRLILVPEQQGWKVRDYSLQALTRAELLMRRD